MLIVVNTVSALVHIYSIGYMHHDPHRPRFFAYLSLFTFAMLMLVTSDNLVQMFFGWEGVGLASYLLIGFWYKKPSASAAAIKAFVVNRDWRFRIPPRHFRPVRAVRIGQFRHDLCQCFEAYLPAAVHGEASTAPAAEGAHGAAPAQAEPAAPAAEAAQPATDGHGAEAAGRDARRDGDELPRLCARTSQAALTVVCLLLFMGAMGKSAQVPLHTWLPDAMEGPTPVSALIHAATMVTAGVFMLARLSPVFELSANRTDGRHLHRRDSRPSSPRRSASSRTTSSASSPIRPARSSATCSWALGMGFYSGRHFPSVHARFLQGAAVPRFRLGHPCRLGRAGHAQDGRPEASSSRSTYWMMVIGTLALTGVGIPATLIGTAGFFSKDAIIEGAFVGHNAVRRVCVRACSWSLHASPASIRGGSFS
jgi:NADH-quinone oxidoreductase subunit L